MSKVTLLVLKYIFLCFERSRPMIGPWTKLAWERLLVYIKRKISIYFFIPFLHHISLIKGNDNNALRIAHNYCCYFKRSKSERIIRITLGNGNAFRKFIVHTDAQFAQRRSRSRNFESSLRIFSGPGNCYRSETAFKATERSKMYFELLSAAAPATRPLGVQQCSKL